MKYPLISDSLTADEAILDAELVKSVPPSITADTGMDVFTHALESYVSTGHNEFSAALAEKAMEICGVFLLRAYLDGSDMHARQKMHVASCLAGLSFKSRVARRLVGVTCSFLSAGLAIPLVSQYLDELHAAGSAAESLREDKV